ncbi:MAG: tRNA (N6-threonylcarbamoyladenosine(37)-N6)-methyltransferase TrmO [Euryarchaeota archaeon]|nr:tRNA (N6-threonylcarbamoyladenosine(37)-N6)-methyltransferase TrmO [Euryarchaeota archaeon]
MTQETHRESFALHPIGQIESGYHSFGEVPHPPGKGGWNEDISTIALYPEHAGKISGLDGYSHIIILFWIHKSGEWKMPAHDHHHDRHDPHDQRDHHQHHHNHSHSHKPAHVKVFATRMPVRPNPIGLSVVELMDFSPESGRVMVKGLDALNGTPILDIKPYIPNFDSYPEASLPEWVGKRLKEHRQQHTEDDS